MQSQSTDIFCVGWLMKLIKGEGGGSKQALMADMNGYESVRMFMKHKHKIIFKNDEILWKKNKISQ